MGVRLVINFSLEFKISNFVSKNFGNWLQLVPVTRITPDNTLRVTIGDLQDYHTKNPKITLKPSKILQKYHRSLQRQPLRIIRNISPISQGSFHQETLYWCLILVHSTRIDHSSKVRSVSYFYN